MRRIRIRRWVQRKCAQLEMLGTLIESIQAQNIEIAGMKEELCVLSHSNGLKEGALDRQKQIFQALEDEHKRLQIKYVQLLKEVQQSDKVLFSSHAAWVQELEA